MRFIEHTQQNCSDRQEIGIPQRIFKQAVDSQHAQRGISPPIGSTWLHTAQAVKPDPQRHKQRQQTCHAGFGGKLKYQVMRIVVKTGDIACPQHRQQLEVMPGELSEAHSQPGRLHEYQARFVPQVQTDAAVGISAIVGNQPLQGICSAIRSGHERHLHEQIHQPEPDNQQCAISQ